MESVFPPRPLSTTSCPWGSFPTNLGFLRLPSAAALRGSSIWRWRLPHRATTLRISSCSRPTSEAAADGPVGSHWGSDKVEVIGIGSRKDAIIDFCLESPFASSSRLRFLTIHSRDSIKVQLLQRTSEEGMVLRNMDFPLSLHPRPPAIVLVASAGHGLDDIMALEVLNAAKAEGGLAFAVLLKPFCFEGQRRKQEVDDLIDKLQKCTHFYIVVETDALLKTEEGTLAEAIRIVNTAVLLAINMISALIDDTHLKFLDTPDEQVKELQSVESLKFLESYGESEVGYGAGYHIKSSIAQAVFNCPFLTSDMKGSNGIVFFTLASAEVMGKNELSAAIHVFRQITQCTKQIIFCGIHEPDLEQNLVITTLLVLGCNEQKISQKKGFLSGLVRHFPFFFSSLGRDRSGRNDDPPNYRNYHPEDGFLSDDGSTSSLDIGDGALQNLDSHPEELENVSWGKYENLELLLYDTCLVDGRILTLLYQCRTIGVGIKMKVGVSESSCEPALDGYHQTDDDENGFQREQLLNWIFGPGFHIAKLWAEERSAFSGTSSKIDRLHVFTFPVGVKSPERSKDGQQSLEAIDSDILDGMSGEPLDKLNFPSRDGLTGASIEAVTDMYNSALTLIKGKGVDSTRKQGLLSVRAASMLEAERESEKKWSPLVEMDYRGGLYRGRCQGGLPEGKGCLTLTDGSFYDGMWRSGKRSGLGTFCYSNGDVFQGTWRDDLMHGKGWFYFHNGDRWFANFWKGKASSEGRYYSKSGSVFFGHFRNGWRHGECLYIDSDGSRWAEIWADGVLVSRTELDSGSGG